MAHWFGFFQTSAEVAATLIGLLVVAISVNLRQILDVPHLPARAAGTLTPLAGMLAIAMLGLIPGQPLQAFGAEAVAVGVAASATAAITLLRILPMHRGLPPWWLWSQILLGQGQVPPLAIAAVLLLIGDANGLYWMVPMVLMSLLAGIINAWVLLVEIMR